MGTIIITPGGAKVLRAMIVSCGSSGCFESVQKLEKVKASTELTRVGQDDKGNWQMAAFSRLKDFAIDEGTETLDTYDVIRYFGGQFHIGIMERIADHAGMGQYLGPYVGLVSHVALPLTNGCYENGGHKVTFSGHLLEYNPKEKGTPFYHLGVVVRIKVTGEQVEAIKAEQRSSKLFMRALAMIKRPIVPPPEYWEALNCTVRKVIQE